MREKELREAAGCVICGNKIGHGGYLTFYRVSIERHIVNARAVSRQAGLEQMLNGCAALAQIMGPDEEMTTMVQPKETVTVCEMCSHEPVILMGLILPKG